MRDFRHGRLLLIVVLSGVLLTVVLLTVPLFPGGNTALGSRIHAQAAALTATSTPSPPVPPSASPNPRAVATPSPTVQRLDILALGDSVTSGSRCGCTAFPALYGKELASTDLVTTHVVNDGVPGLTSAGVLSQLRSTPGERAVRKAEVVLVTIGANDFSPVAQKVVTHSCGDPDNLGCAQSGLAVLGRNLSAIVDRVHALRQASPTAVLVTGYWDVYEDGDVADADYSRSGRTESEKLTRAVNAVIEAAVKRSGATYVDLYAPFKGADGTSNPTALLADDGDHPNAAGHRVIAAALEAAGLAPLQVQRR